MTLKNKTNLAKKACKPTWFKAEVEPCVGTSLFFEVPIDAIVNEPLTSKKKSGDRKNALASPMQQQHSDDQNNKSKSSLGTSKKQKKTLVLNPKKSQILPLKRLNHELAEP